MKYADCITTVSGGLALLLVFSACSSDPNPKPRTKYTWGAMSPPDMPRSDVVTDRGTTPAPAYSPIDHPIDRTGRSDRSPEMMAACPSKTDAQGKVVFDDPTCPDRYRQQAAEKERTALAAACPSKTDAQGKVVFDDPTCPDRYRSQVSTTNDKDRAGLAAACPSRVDATGKTIYDDPSCPERYRQVSEKDRAALAAACPSQVDAAGNAVYDDPSCPERFQRETASIREARIRLARAAGLKAWDEPSVVGERDRAALAAACPSRVDATGNAVYDDPGCPERYRRQKENSDARAALVAACSSHVDATGKIVYDDPACLARNRYLTQENAYYDRYIDKAVKHARTAEIAASEGNVPDMLQHAEISLDQAKEARRAGNNADLAAGILALRQTIAYGQMNEVRATPVATPVARTRTVKGELSRGTGEKRADGKESYVVRDPQNREVPIALSQEMNQQVQVGDMVEAQIDPDGQVTSITKAQ